MSEVSLREYFEARLAEFDRRIGGVIEDRDTRIQIALTAAKEAVGKAEQANERRLELLNEFRAQQADESRKYALASIVEQAFDGQDKRIIRLETLLASLQGRALALAGFGALVGGIVTAFILKAIG
jgi:hypothetical protein